MVVSVSGGGKHGGNNGVVVVAVLVELGDTDTTRPPMLSMDEANEALARQI